MRRFLLQVMVSTMFLVGTTAHAQIIASFGGSISLSRSTGLKHGTLNNPSGVVGQNRVPLGEFVIKANDVEEVDVRYISLRDTLRNDVNVSLSTVFSTIWLESASPEGDSLGNYASGIIGMPVAVMPTHWTYEFLLFETPLTLNRGREFKVRIMGSSHGGATSEAIERLNYCLGGVIYPNSVIGFGVSSGSMIESRMIDGLQRVFLAIHGHFTVTNDGTSIIGVSRGTTFVSCGKFVLSVYGEDLMGNGVLFSLYACDATTGKSMALRPGEMKNFELYINGAKYGETQATYAEYGVMSLSNPPRYINYLKFFSPEYYKASKGEITIELKCDIGEDVPPGSIFQVGLLEGYYQDFIDSTSFAGLSSLRMKGTVSAYEIYSDPAVLRNYVGPKMIIDRVIPSEVAHVSIPEKVNFFGTTDLPITVRDVMGMTLKVVCPGASSLFLNGMDAFIGVKIVKGDTLIYIGVSRDGGPQKGVVGSIEVGFLTLTDKLFTLAWSCDYDYALGASKSTSGTTLIQLFKDFPLHLPGTGVVGDSLYIKVDPRITVVSMEAHGVPGFIYSTENKGEYIYVTDGYGLMQYDWPDTSSPYVVILMDDDTGSKWGKRIVIAPRYGDVTADNATDIRDVIKIIRYLLGIDKLVSYQRATADCYTDRQINRWDAIWIIQKVLGLPLIVVSQGGGGGVHAKITDAQKEDVVKKAGAIIQELEGDTSPEATMLRELLNGVLKELGIEIKTEGVVIPKSFDLKGNYPNPFNPSTTIAFDVPSPSHVVIKVYNMRGQEVATLADREFEAGTHHLVWDASHVSSGQYFVRFSTSSFIQTKKMTLLK